MHSEKIDEQKNYIKTSKTRNKTPTMASKTTGSFKAGNSLASCMSRKDSFKSGNTAVITRTENAKSPMRAEVRKSQQKKSSESRNSG